MCGFVWFSDRLGNWPGNSCVEREKRRELEDKMLSKLLN